MRHYSVLSEDKEHSEWVFCDSGLFVWCHVNVTYCQPSV